MTPFTDKSFLAEINRDWARQKDRNCRFVGYGEQMFVAAVILSMIAAGLWLAILGWC